MIDMTALCLRSFSSVLYDPNIEKLVELFSAYWIICGGFLNPEIRLNPKTITSEFPEIGSGTQDF